MKNRKFMAVMSLLLLPVVFYPFASTAWFDKAHLAISPIAEYSNRRITGGQPHAYAKRDRMVGNTLRVPQNWIAWNYIRAYVES